MRVYLSSTLNDLGLEREAIRKALGGHCTVVESYTADERSVRESCLADVAGCDLYIGIIGRRYGFIPPGESFSIPELEYLQAREHKLPTFIFIKDDDVILNRFHDAGTQENPPERIESFRQRVNNGTEEACVPHNLQDPGRSQNRSRECPLALFKSAGRYPPAETHCGSSIPGLACLFDRRARSILRPGCGNRSAG
jgi:hypothetical protein